MAKAKTLNQYKKELSLDATIESSFIIPFNKLLTGLKLITKDSKGKKLKTPYVEASICLPQEVGTTIHEVVGSKWGLGLIGIKSKVKK